MPYKNKDKQQSYQKAYREADKERLSHLLKRKRRLSNPQLLGKDILNPLGLYRCSKCGIFKTKNKFSKDSSKSSGVSNTCKSCFKEYQKVYRTSNKNKTRRYYNTKYLEDPIYKVRMNLKNRLNSILKRKKVSKRYSSYQILGCPYEELILKLNDNPYGYSYGQEGLDIDHIIPVSIATTEEELLKLNHYTNLQLLPSYYNRHIKKDNEFNKKHFEQWLKENN